MNIVQTDNVVYEYERRDEEGNAIGVTTAVDHVSLDVREGSFIAILGHNGSGKSTLAKHINAILSPKEGTALTKFFVNITSILPLIVGPIGLPV